MRCRWSELRGLVGTASDMDAIGRWGTRQTFPTIQVRQLYLHETNGPQPSLTLVNATDPYLPQSPFNCGLYGFRAVIRHDQAERVHQRFWQSVFVDLPYSLPTRERVTDARPKGPCEFNLALLSVVNGARWHGL